MFRLSKKLPVKLPIRRTGSHRDDEFVVSRGQIIVLFALMLPVMIGIMGIAIDVSYAWVNELRIQKTADAAALAGAVYLPDNAGPAATASLAEATQNGYTNNSGGVVIDAHQDAGNPEQMDVAISAPVPTFFMRLVGINTLTPTRMARAQFHLPVPMGSPLNVFGSPTAKDLQGNPLNFWAGIQGPCALKANGDPYATKDFTSPSPSNCSTAPVTNGEYKPPSTGDPGAYDYAVKVPVGGTLLIELYDPEFCNRTNQNQDTGDSNMQTSGSNFNTIFTLYNPSTTPYDLADDTVKTAVTYPGDQSGSTSDGQGGKTHSCSSYYGTGSSGSFTGKWVTYASIPAVAGTYRLNVQTVTVGGNPADGSNMFSIRATLNAGTGSQPSVYAGLAGSQSAMSIYNNLTAGDSWIYLAQINSTLQGKTMEVDLFDPGDAAGTATMYFEQPGSAAGSYSPVTFSWRNAGTTMSGNGTTTSNATSLVTANGGNSNFQGDWVVVKIKIPATYDGSPNNSGWWKIKYNMTAAAHDRTTWRVSIIDSPVHLVP